MTATDYRREVWRRGGRAVVAKALNMHPGTLDKRQRGIFPRNPRILGLELQALAALPVVNQEPTASQLRLHKRAKAGAKARARNLKEAK